MPLQTSDGTGLRILELPEGEWRPARRPDRLAVVTRGLLVRELTIGRSVSSEILGPGDLVIGATEDTPQELRWFVAAPSRLLLVREHELTAPAGRSTVGARLLEGASKQLGRSSVHAAICCLPRVEDRVLGLLWHLAERWGRVTPDGVVVPLEFTHTGLGHLVGSRRPTVSLALKALAEEGTVARLPDGTWLLDPAGAKVLESVERATRGGPAPVRTRAALKGMPAIRVALPEGAASRHDALAARIDHLRSENARIRRRIDATLAASERLRSAALARRGQQDRPAAA